MSLIQLSHLHFTYEGSYDPVFQDLSLQFDTAWKLGLIGRNGRGKTTLLNLLQGRYEYSGQISAATAFSYFPFSVPDGSLPCEQLVKTLCPHIPQWELARELARLELSDEVLPRSFHTLSPGEQTKLLLALLFLQQTDYLLIDEPTNHLDLHGRELVARYLRGKQGFLLVSHDRSFLDGCVDHILALNREGCDVQRGNFSSWYQNKMEQDARELAHNAKLSQEVDRLKEAAQRSAKWSDQMEKTKHGTRNAGLRPDRGFIGHKAAKMMQRSMSIETRRQTAIEEKSGLLKNIERTPPLKLAQLSYHTKRLLSLSELAVCYDGKAVSVPISFEVEQGDRLAIRGANGSGKSSMLKLLAGEALTHTGHLARGSQLKVSYVRQDTSLLRGTLTDFAAKEGIDETLFKTILRKLDFSRAQFDKAMEHFSEGQKKKVLLAKSLSERSHLLLWDEPLNYIDLYSRMQIEELLRAAMPTIVFVEHDKHFTTQVASKFVDLQAAARD